MFLLSQDVVFALNFNRAICWFCRELTIGNKIKETIRGMKREEEEEDTLLYLYDELSTCLQMQPVAKTVLIDVIKYDISCPSVYKCNQLPKLFLYNHYLSV